ncbi:MAG: glycosyltransferase [Deltaproteobacteria bacterium]|nr:glycosyltransferase [Deltaproteobacteria bacterium]
MATTLAAAHHDVTILYLWASRSDEREMRYWQNHFRAIDIAFVPLPASPGIEDVPGCMQTARDAHAWLRKQQFDVIHFPELHGHAYYCVLAKHQGLDFHRTILCVGTHSPISWIREQNKEAPYSPEELEMDFMERQSVALADIVVSPSQYMLAWMQARGWVLPAACYVQQNITPPELTSSFNLTRQERARGATNLVFFGRLEARKGIGLFCDALDLLSHATSPNFNVTFLGKNGRVAGRDGVSFIRARAKKWAFPYRTLTDYTREAALQFLSEDPGRIAIIPSFEDNLPSTVTECLACKIPFLAGRGGGIPELIARSDLESTTFLPNAVQLAERLAIAMREGVPVARSAIDAEENRQRWIDWHSALASRGDDSVRSEQKGGERPIESLVTVCLNYSGDGELLRQSLQSLRDQTYPRIEVLISGCGADAAENEFQDLTHDFESKGWRVAQRPWSDYCSEVQGKYVLFMEAADCLIPDAVGTFVRVANQTDADILTCFLELFIGRQRPVDDARMGNYPFLGGAVLSGVFHNHFGSRVIFLKRDALVRLRTFPASARRECADWEFLARAALMNCRMEVIPVALAWYRISDEPGSRLPMEYRDQLQAILPYAREMPASLRDLPAAALTMWLHYQNCYKRLHDSPANTMLQRLSNSRDQHNGNWGIADEGAFLLALNRMPKRARQKVASMLDGWLEYSSARAQLPPAGLPRISLIARQLVRGHYHRYGHGLGSALRDLRKPSQVRQTIEN